MRWIIALSLLLAACAPDDHPDIRAFDVSSLTSRHQVLFTGAVDNLNTRYPEAGLSIHPESLSRVYYGEDDDIPTASTFGPLSRGEWLIRLHPDAPSWLELFFFRVIVHELCHVLGIDHENGNPQGGNC